MLKKVILLSFFLACFISAFSFDFDNYLREHEKANDKAFFNQFPYSAYLSVYQIDNIAILEKHRKQISQTGKSGDTFIFNVVKQYIKEFNFSSDSLMQIASLIQTGVFYLNTDENITDSTYIYIDAGDHILQKSVHFIEEEIKNKHLDVENSQVKFLIDKCEKNGFMIKFDMPDSDKIILHIKNGNWNYLWKKFKSRCYDNKYLCLGAAILLILILIIFIRKFKKRKNIKS